MLYSVTEVLMHFEKDFYSWLACDWKNKKTFQLEGQLPACQ